MKIDNVKIGFEHRPRHATGAEQCMPGREALQGQADVIAWWETS